MLGSPERGKSGGIKSNFNQGTVPWKFDGNRARNEFVTWCSGSFCGWRERRSELVWDFSDKDCPGNHSWGTWPGEWRGKGRCRRWKDLTTCVLWSLLPTCLLASKVLLVFLVFLRAVCSFQRQDAEPLLYPGQEWLPEYAFFPNPQKAILCLSNRSSAELGMGCATMTGTGKQVKNQQKWNILRPGCAGGNR